MYATRLLSDLQKNPELLAAKPDGPNSGYLVIQDEESKKVQSCLSWSNKSKFHKKLPFPQDKEVLIEYIDDHRQDPVFFIPVLNRPLSRNCYYAIVPDGRHKGKAFTSSRVEDRVPIGLKICCCVLHDTEIEDVPPTPLDPQSLYQQFKIIGSETFKATTKARDGIEPLRLRGRENWGISFRKPDNNLKLDPTAQGLDPTLRARLPEFKFPLSETPFVVGKWYSPFTFVQEGTVSEQVTMSMYYEVTLEQRWERTDTWINDDDNVLESVEVFVGGTKVRWNAKVKSGVVWYTSGGGGEGKKKTRVGLRKEVVERMLWEQKRGGWVDECPEEGGDWSEFGRYVLVESFKFRRMDGSLVMSFDFMHFNQTRTHITY